MCFTFCPIFGLNILQNELLILSRMRVKHVDFQYRMSEAQSVPAPMSKNGARTVLCGHGWKLIDCEAPMSKSRERTVLGGHGWKYVDKDGQVLCRFADG